MWVANMAGATTPIRHTLANASKHHVEVHAVDANRWVVFDAQINVLLDTEAEISGVWEILLVQLVLFHLQLLIN